MQHTLRHAYEFMWVSHIRRQYFIYDLHMIFDHFALSPICDNCPKRVNNVCHCLSSVVRCIRHLSRGQWFKLVLMACELQAKWSRAAVPQLDCAIRGPEQAPCTE